MGCVVVVGVALAAWPVAGAAAPKRDPVEEAAYEGGLSPALVPVFRAATAAADADRLDEARAGFQRVVDEVPRHAPSLRRLAWVLSRGKQTAEAVALGRRALAADGGPESKTLLAVILVGTGAPADKAEARRLVAESSREKPSEEAATLIAQIAMEDSDQLALADAVRDLRKLAPDGLSASFYGALLSLMRNEPEEADRLLERAVRAGLPAAVAADLREKTGLARHLSIWRYIELAGLSFVGWLLGLLALYRIGRSLSARTLAAIERAAGDATALKGRIGRLRVVYARAIAAAAAYYYVSIPFVLALVVLGAAAVILAFLWIGWLPIYWLLLLVLGTLYSIWAVVRSLLASRGPEQDPGRKLGEAEAPALWALLREVAAQVGTRPVDAVFITPGTDLAVAERGPLRARLADRGQRFLVLGIGVLPGFSLGGFRAVLAHEYGHFSHRDTAGGGMADAVVAALARTLTALANRGGLLIVNPAWHFLRIFCGLFMRITQGASRLQEVMADHFAARAYGPKAFADGLTHVVGRSVTWKRESQYLVELAEKQRKPVASLYRSPPEGADRPADDAAAIAEAMDAKPSDFDSHPPPRQRIEWVMRLPAPPPAAQPEPEAWSLFPDRSAVEAEMTAVINDRLEREGAIDEPPIPPFVPPPASAD